jgi:hypothetical protein
MTPDHSALGYDITAAGKPKVFSKMALFGPER